MRRIGLLLAVAALALTVAAPVRRATRPLDRRRRHRGQRVVRRIRPSDRCGGPHRAGGHPGRQSPVHGLRPHRRRIRGPVRPARRDGHRPDPGGHAAAVLLHHVAPGERLSGSVLGAGRDPDAGQVVHVPVARWRPSPIDGAAIVIADVDVSNGVIHVIDEVLLP